MKRSKECWQQQDSDLGSWTRFFKTQILEYVCMLRDTIINKGENYYSGKRKDLAGS